jgi:hypothetical protein
MPVLREIDARGFELASQAAVDEPVYQAGVQAHEVHALDVAVAVLAHFEQHYGVVRSFPRAHVPKP